MGTKSSSKKTAERLGVFEEAPIKPMDGSSQSMKDYQSYTILISTLILAKIVIKVVLKKVVDLETQSDVKDFNFNFDD